MSTIFGKILRGASKVVSTAAGVVGTALTVIPFPPIQAVGAGLDIVAAGAGAASAAYAKKDANVAASNQQDQLDAQARKLGYANYNAYLAAKAAAAGIGQTTPANQSIQNLQNGQTGSTSSTGNALPLLGVGLLALKLLK